MTVLFDRRGARFAVVGVLAALALAGCGRKSGLEPPPSASIAQPGQPVPPQPPSLGETGTGLTFGPRLGSAPAPATPPAPANAAKRTFILDPLLD